MGDDKKFVMLPKESVHIIAQSVGISDISESISKILAEDVCYRLREITQASTQFMKHAKRKRLNAEDFNKALRWSDVDPIHGYSSSEPVVFSTVKDAEDLLLVDDKEINLKALATDKKVLCESGQTTVKAAWVAIEGIQNTTGSGVTHELNSLSSHLQQYYKDVTKTILESDDQNVKVYLDDLRRNTRVSGLLPHLVNFASSGVKTATHDLCQLTRLMQLVEALMHNQSLYLGPYLVNLLTTVMYCVLEPLAVSINPINDHWTLRDYAAKLLAQIVRTSKEMFARFKHRLLATLRAVLADPARPLCSHYGAVVGLCALGTRAVEEVLMSQLETYWPTLQQVLEDTSLSNSQVKSDGHKVHGAIMAAAEMLLKSKQNDDLDQEADDIHDLSESASPDHQAQFSFGTASHLAHLGKTSSSSTASNQDSRSAKQRSISESYAELYEYFGDGLMPRLPPPRITWNYSVQNKELNLKQLLDADVHADEARRYRCGLLDIARKKNPDRPRLLSITGREGLRPRHGKTTKKQRGRLASLKDAFPLAKTVKITRKADFTMEMNIAGRLVSRTLVKRDTTLKSCLMVNADVWKVNLRMSLFGRKTTSLNHSKHVNQGSVFDLISYI